MMQDHAATHQGLRADTCPYERERQKKGPRNHCGPTDGSGTHTQKSFTSPLSVICASQEKLINRGNCIVSGSSLYGRFGTNAVFLGAAARRLSVYSLGHEIVDANKAEFKGCLGRFRNCALSARELTKKITICIQEVVEEFSDLD